jgi:hypothetical protein
MAKHAVAANGAGTVETKKALSMWYHDTSTSKATDGAVSACLAKCVQIADPEVTGFRQFSPIRLSRRNRPNST